MHYSGICWAASIENRDFFHGAESYGPFFFEVFPYVSLNRLLFYPDVPDLDRSGQIVHLIDEDNIYIYNWMIEAFLKSNVPALGAAQKDRLRVRHFHVVTNDAVLILV